MKRKIVKAKVEMPQNARKVFICSQNVTDD